MKTYAFYDSDGFDGERDLCGDKYKELIEYCCRNSRYLSFILSRTQTPMFAELERFSIPKPDKIGESSDRYKFAENFETVYFRVCPELCRLLVDSAESIFEWIEGWGYHNPMDPAFYREDGSLIFSSVIHEGEIFLYEKDGEDAGCIISNGGWETPRKYFGK